MKSICVWIHWLLSTSTTIPIGTEDGFTLTQPPYYGMGSTSWVRDSFLLFSNFSGSRRRVAGPNEHSPFGQTTVTPRQNNPSLFFSGTEVRQDDFIAAAICAGRCQRRPDLVGIVHCWGHTGGNVEFHLDARGTLTLQRALQAASRGSITRHHAAASRGRTGPGRLAWCTTEKLSLSSPH